MKARAITPKDRPKPTPILAEGLRPGAALEDVGLVMEVVEDEDLAMEVVEDEDLAMEVVEDEDLAIAVVEDEEVAVDVVADEEVAVDVVADVETGVDVVVDAEEDVDIVRGLLAVVSALELVAWDEGSLGANVGLVLGVVSVATWTMELMLD